ncbi:inositol polyphosphate kinase kcs1 [Massospora cicadina]|nr:inositol polyphosphate kinase kcs1 [Massospora cicadina]
MQIYKSLEKRYIYHDKYFGRKLSTKGFRESLVDYLHDGEKLLVHLLPSLISKLRKLFNIIRSLEGYRFYASSLLFLYDGEPTSPLHNQIDIKIIDFANCVHAAMFSSESNLVGTVYPRPIFPPSTLGPDHGYLRGIATLLNELQELWYLHASPELQELHHNEILVDKEFPGAY